MSPPTRRGSSGQTRMPPLLSSSRRRALLDDHIAIIGRVSHDLRSRDGPAPEPQGRGLHPPVPPAPGPEQPGEPAPAICALPACPRSRLAGGRRRGRRRRSRPERGRRRPSARLQGPDRPRHPGRGRDHPVLRRHPARPQLFGLVSAARPVRLSPVLDRGSRWRLRSGIGQRPPPVRPQGHHLRGRAAHHARAPDRRPAQQGRTRRTGVEPASRIDTRCWRRGGQGSRPRDPGPDHPGLHELPGAGLSRQGDADLRPWRPWRAAARPVRRGGMATGDARSDHPDPEESRPTPGPSSMAGPAPATRCIPTAN